VPVERFDALSAVIAEPFAVITPAENSPLAPRATMVEAPLADDAVVLAFASVPAEILFALIPVTADPSPLKVAVIVPAANSPLAPRATIVLAPLAEEAVVLALAKVPLEMFDAFRLVMFAPLNVAVVDPVPPEATGSAVASVREVR
jgi:hypothetical protein